MRKLRNVPLSAEEHDVLGAELFAVNRTLQRALCLVGRSHALGGPEVAHVRATIKALDKVRSDLENAACASGFDGVSLYWGRRGA